MTIASNGFAVVLAATAVAWAGLAFVPASHAERPDTFRVTIKYDASAPAPVTYARIEEQAARACKRESSHSSLTFLADRRQAVGDCMEEVVGKAVTAIDKPELLAHHNGKRDLGKQVAAR